VGCRFAAPVWSARAQCVECLLRTRICSLGASFSLFRLRNFFMRLLRMDLPMVARLLWEERRRLLVDCAAAQTGKGGKRGRLAETTAPQVSSSKRSASASLCPSCSLLRCGSLPPRASLPRPCAVFCWTDSLASSPFAAPACWPQPKRRAQRRAAARKDRKVGRKATDTRACTRLEGGAQERTPAASDRERGRRSRGLVATTPCVACRSQCGQIGTPQT
jgi:hypothetical protein